MARLVAPRRGLAAVAVSAALGSALLGGVPATSASAADEPPSTPVPMATPDGSLASYLLNARTANPGQTRLVERAVERSGGVVVQSWPAIGVVVVAHSTNGDFRADVAQASGRALESVGSTRSVAVTEGTPSGVQTPWGPGASGSKKGAKKATNGGRRQRADHRHHQ